MIDEPAAKSLRNAMLSIRDLSVACHSELIRFAHQLSDNYSGVKQSTLAVLLDQNVVIASRDEAPDRVPIYYSLGDVKEGDDARSKRLRQIVVASHASQDVAVQLGQAMVLTASVSLPKTSRRTLIQALRYELARLSPIEQDGLYFDFVTQPSARSTNTRTVRLRIVKREIVDAAIAVCSGAGLRVSSIRFENDPCEADFRLFPIDRVAYLRTIWRRWNIAMLSGAVLLLGLILLLSAFVRHIEIGKALSVQVTREQGRAAIVDRLEQQVGLARIESQFLVRQKRSPMLVSVLTELSQTLPDNTWITQLSMEGDKLKLEGYSNAASDLIGVFDHSSQFKDAQFTAPLTQDSRAGIERFDLFVRVRPQMP